MLNIFSKSLRKAKPVFWLLFAVFFGTALPLTVDAAAPKYKKSTVVDFDGALVEGKSRKPYSAYLTQQKDSAYGELHQWQPDLNKSLQDAQTRLDRTQ